MQLKKLSRKQKGYLLILGLLVILFLILSGKLFQKDGQLTDKTPVANEELLILGTSDSIEGLGNTEVYTDQGVYSFEKEIDWTPYLFQSVQAVTEEHKILHINNLLQREVKLENCLITENTADTLTIFSEGFSVDLPWRNLTVSFSDEIADIYLTNGSITRISTKKESISGKVLSVRADGIEMEGYGIVPVAERFRFYETYGAYREKSAYGLISGCDSMYQANDELYAIEVLKPDGLDVRILRMNFDDEYIFYDSLGNVKTSGKIITGDYTYEYNDEDSWKYATLDTLKVNPNDHLTINLSVNPRHGNLDVNITTDENIVKESTEVEILEMWAPQNPPQIVAAGFTDGDHAVVEGDRSGNNATVSVLARGGIKNFFVKFESDYFDQAGIDIPLGVEIDLANPTAENQAHYEKLRAAGLNWQDDMLHSRRLTYLTMTSLFQRINELNPSLEVERNLFNMSVKVVDEVDKVTEQSLSATAYPITQELVLNEGDVWARKIVSPKLEVTRGVSSLYVLQVSTDGQQTWSDLKTYQSAKDNVLDFGTLDVTPATTYHFRTIYNNNPNLMSDVVTVTTESELQVGNPGFEEYQTVIMHVSPLGWLYDYDREWYLPYKNGETDPWWAVNSKKTMPDGHTAWTSNFCKNFPCTAYSTTRRSGEKSALIYAINVSDGNTDGTAIGTTVPGEIWIGTADNNGNHATDGHAFASRPAVFTFWYRYSPLSGETFSVEVVLYDNAGVEIGRADVTDGSATSEWTQMEMPIVYSNLTSKAAKIYVSFKSSVSPAVNIASTMEIAGKQQTAHMGSALRIDDIELVY